MFDSHNCVAMHLLYLSPGAFQSAPLRASLLPTVVELQGLRLLEKKRAAQLS
jgi:hypothetical protein